ncbi:TPA: hypothetical protein HPU08_002894 [Listeria monocytogenes]|nr:hypothetical protein [Listeria monocytogenes]
MNKKLQKKYKQETQLEEQMRLLQEKIDNAKAEREELEKLELHKTFNTFNISLEEYTKIITKAVNRYQGNEENI